MGGIRVTVCVRARNGCSLAPAHPNLKSTSPKGADEAGQRSKLPDHDTERHGAVVLCSRPRLWPSRASTLHNRPYRLTD